MRLAILASGSGSNAEKIMEHFAHSSKGVIALVASNKADAGVLARAAKFGVPTFTFTRKEMDAGVLLAKLQQEQIDWVILAGFLLKVPDELIRAFLIEWSISIRLYCRITEAKACMATTSTRR